MNDQLSKDVRTIVDEIFKEKEEVEMKTETEGALNKAAETITQLTESLEAKDGEHEAEVTGLRETITSLEAQLNELAQSKQALEDEKAKFDKEKEELIKRATTVEAELENIKKNKLAEDRMNVLKSAGVASTNVEAQQGKVKEMSEEDFVAYKDELVSVRDSILNQLKASETVDTKIDEVVVEDPATKVDSEESSEEEAATNTEESINMMQAVAAALNMEIKPTESVLAKYRELGTQMAENIKTSLVKK